MCLFMILIVLLYIDLQFIEKKLPHRYPFLLVDKIIELSDTQIVGVKNITFNEWFFAGSLSRQPDYAGCITNRSAGAMRRNPRDQPQWRGPVRHLFPEDQQLQIQANGEDREIRCYSKWSCPPRYAEASVK